MFCHHEEITDLACHKAGVHTLAITTIPATVTAHHHDSPIAWVRLGATLAQHHQHLILVNDPERGVIYLFEHDPATLLARLAALPDLPENPAE